MRDIPARKLVWLASFPKSGNTWLRLFLANYIANCQEPFPINKIHMFTFSDMMGSPYERLTGKALKELTEQEVHSLRPRVHRAMASQKADVMLVKTHQAVLKLYNVATVTSDVTKASIYILRNPFDVAVSYAHHCKIEPSESLRLLASDRHRTTGDGKSTVSQYLGRWSDHVESWVDNQELSPLVLRYEDMKRQPEAVFAKTVRHLGLAVDEERLERAIRFSSFEELADQETKTDFVERARRADRFFRGGRIGDGLTAFTHDEILQAIDIHRPVLQRFDYLDEAGNPKL